MYSLAIRVFLWLLVAVWPAATPLAQVADAENLYELGTGDQIRIQVFGEEDLTLEIRIGDSGVVSYPFLGEIRVSGLTPNQLEAMIADGLRPDYLVEPNVNVNVMEYRPFFVSGEVDEPGGYPFQPGLTVEKAIALAGGFTERASRTRIFLIHDDDPAATRRQVKLGNSLRPGDSLTVEPSFF